MIELGTFYTSFPGAESVAMMQQISLQRGIEGAFGLPTTNARDHAKVKAGMQNYLAYMNAENRFQEFIEGYKKASFKESGKKLPDGNFVLSNYIGRSFWSNWQKLNKEDGLFYTDGRHSFSIGYQVAERKNPYWIALAGLSPANDIFFYRISDEPKEKEELVLMQLQGVSDGRPPEDEQSLAPYNPTPTGDYRATYPDEKDYLFCKEILNSIQWPYALIDLATEMARSIGLPVLQIQPAENSAWKARIPKDLDRLKRRYNYTAQRRGFKRGANGDGFFTKSLD